MENVNQALLLQETPRFTQRTQSQIKWAAGSLGFFAGLGITFDLMLENRTYIIILSSIVGAILIALALIYFRLKVLAGNNEENQHDAQDFKNQAFCALISTTAIGILLVGVVVLALFPPATHTAIKNIAATP